MQLIINQISEAPQRIQQAELKILEQANIIADMKKNMSSISKATLCAVASEVDGSGKKVYTNAESREHETEKRLLLNEEYQQLKKAMSEAEYKKSQEEIGLQCIKDEFSSNRYKIRLQCASKIEKASENFLGGMQILAGLDKLLTQLSNPAPSAQVTQEMPPDCPW